MAAAEETGAVILVIEDDLAIGGLVEQVLREAGFQPTWVRDVDAARTAAAEGLLPRAILSDLMVAGSAGPTLLPSEIAALFPGAPLALITGVPAKRRAALGVVHEPVIEKPFELETLLGALTALVNRG